MEAALLVADQSTRMVVLRRPQASADGEMKRSSLFA